MSILKHVGNRYPETDWLLKVGLTVFMLDVNRGVQWLSGRVLDSR